MVERESQYFLNSFCRDYLGLEWSGEVVEECDDLADRASQYRSGYFLHRDFQSRNIMLLNDRVVFIDYQAGRLGPIGYDIASLLLDPYVAMPPDIREQYLGYYMKCLRENGVETGGFELSYRVLSLQRNLQIIGAFAFLTQKRNKLFFKQFLKPALVHLATLLGDHFPSYRALADLVGRSRQLLLQA